MLQMGATHQWRCVSFKLLVAAPCKTPMGSRREETLVGVTPKATIISDDYPPVFHISYYVCFKDHRQNDCFALWKIWCYKTI